MQQAVLKNQVSQRQNITNFREVSPESERTKSMAKSDYKDSTKFQTE